MLETRDVLQKIESLNSKIGKFKANIARPQKNLWGTNTNHEPEEVWLDSYLYKL